MWKRPKGVGNKPRPVELDPAMWLCLIWTWIKDTTKTFGTEQACWAELVELDRVFFNSKDIASTRIRNLENRIHRFKKAHKKDILELSKTIHTQAVALFSS